MRLTNYLGTILILIFIILISGCKSDKKHFQTEKSVIVAGKVFNHEKYPDNYTVKIYENKLIDTKGSYHTATLKSDGSFKIKFSRVFSGDMYFIYGKMFSVFANPGDSIYLEFDADDFLGRNVKWNNDFKSLKFSGSNAKTNEEIKLFNYLRYKNSNPGENTNNEKKMTPEEYLFFLKNKKMQRQHILVSLSQTKELTKTFIRWAKLSIDYVFAGSLFHYTWFNPAYGINADKKTRFKVIDIPNSFYESISNIPLDNEDAIICLNYSRFLHEYFITNTFYKSEYIKRVLKEKANFIKSEDYQRVVEDLLQSIKKEYTGIAYEILISRQLFNLMQQRMDVFKILYPKYKGDLRTSFRSIIYNKYSEIKLKKKNPSANKTFLKKGNEVEIVAGDILNKIIEKHEGKVIYLDFWATWCGPCLMEFKHSKKVAEIFKNQNVAFVYICVKSKSEAWKRKIADYNLPGNHYLLNDSEYDILSQKFQIGGIPHYVLIDNKGNVVDKNTLRPSSGSQLVDLINKYIDK